MTQRAVLKNIAGEPLVILEPGAGTANGVHLIVTDSKGAWVTLDELRRLVAEAGGLVAPPVLFQLAQIRNRERAKVKAWLETGEAAGDQLRYVRAPTWNDYEASERELTRALDAAGCAPEEP